jgi:hypothetical protein
MAPLVGSRLFVTVLAHYELNNDLTYQHLFSYLSIRAELLLQPSSALLKATPPRIMPAPMCPPALPSNMSSQVLSAHKK